MIFKLIHLYWNVLLPIGIGSLLLFCKGLFLLLRKTPTVEPVVIQAVQPPADLEAIAGDDVITTQLDLARALIETGRNQSAKELLQYVAEQGNAAQQAKAHQLMAQLCASP
jgi:FimV-like protein